MFFCKKNKGFSYDRFMKKAKRFSPFELEEYNALADHLKENMTKAVFRKLGLKLIVISDTHGHFAFSEERLPAFLNRAGEYDLCILLGDIHPADMEQITELIPKEKILALRGNHDDFDLYENFGIREMSGKTVTYKGVTFAGIEGSFRYKNRNFPSFTQYESLKNFEKLKKADVLISHDGMFEHSKNDMAHVGLAGITRYIYTHAPVWHIHGHSHLSYRKDYDNGTAEKCVYLAECIEI